MGATLTRTSPPPDDLRSLNGAAPARSIQQRMDALATANDRRTRRAELKRDMKAGRKSASAILASPPEWAEQMKVIDLLMAVPKWGRVKVNHALRFCQVSPSKTVGGISQRQRQELLRWLHGR